MEVSGQLNVSAALPVSTHWVGGWVGPIAGLDVVEKSKTLTLPGMETRSSCSYSNCVIPAPE
jgi:hypothetical protein